MIMFFCMIGILENLIPIKAVKWPWSDTHNIFFLWI